MINWATISLKDFAGYVSSSLKKLGIDTVLVGGACVSIYSENLYQSYDLDFVTYEDIRKVKKALLEMGFSEKAGYFMQKGCPWFVEFVSPPVAVGNESIQNFNNIKTPLGLIKMLLPIDSVKDRLCSFYHWNDKEGLKQAINICRMQKIDLKNLKKWSEKEGQLEKFQIFQNQLAKEQNSAGQS